MIERSQVEFPLPRDGDPLEVILKLAGESCNINCHYCFEKRKPYPSAEVLSPSTLRRFLDGLGGRPLSVGLHGGEPLIIGLDRMAGLLAELRRYPGHVQLKLQTNGTLLSDAWLDLFDRSWPELTIGLSVDGDEDASAHRVDFMDRSIQDKVEGALQLLGRRRKSIGIVCVVTSRVVARPKELLAFFAGFDCIRSVNLIPCLDYAVESKTYESKSGATIRVLNPDGQGIPGWATSPSEYAEFLVTAFDAWRDSGAFRRYTIEPFLSILRVLGKKPAESCHFTEQKCAFVLTLYPDGRIGSCDELNMPRALLGQLSDGVAMADVLALRTNEALHGAFRSVLEKCTGCSHRESCGGGCLATRLRYQGSPYDEEYCAYRKRVIDHVARRRSEALSST